MSATVTAVPDDPAPSAELRDRFAQDVPPLLDVLARGARRLTHNDADAEDLVQATVLHAYTGFHTFRAGTNLRAWLFRIMQNQWINSYRWKERRPAELLQGEITDRDLVASGAHTSHGVRSAEDEVLDAFGDDDVRAAIGELSEGFRMVLFYADVEGYTYAQTAVLLNIPIGTVMSRASRARSQLRRSLARMGEERDRAQVAVDDAA
jgi:RNA polymerase sigma-70 factor (ECF subfamily)